MTRSRWNVSDLPRLDDSVVVITGANSGIGFEAARALAGAGAHVVLGCRNPTAGAAARDRIRDEHGAASVEFAALDLADLTSVRAFVDAFRERHARLDVLVNNAGVMALPHRRTADGFEMQLGTNHLGHFALTGLLFERLLATPRSRVVTVSSRAHELGRMRFEDLQGERRYYPWLAYGQSKLANLLFAYELARKLEARALDVTSIACHPGYADTNLQSGAARLARSSFREGAWRVVNRTFAQSTAMGALPTLYAAFAEDVRAGDFIGPGGLLELRGHPVKVTSNRRSHDRETAARLWSVSEELTGVRFEALG